MQRMIASLINHSSIHSLTHFIHLSISVHLSIHLPSIRSYTLSLSLSLSFSFSSMPNFSLAPAIDVIVMGCYPRLPTCIKERIIPPLPLLSAEQSHAYQLLESVIRHRLSHEYLSEAISVTSIGMCGIASASGWVQV